MLILVDFCKMNNLTKYSTNFRSLNKIRQQEQVRPKYYGIYHFGEHSGEPLPNISYIKKMTMEQNLWQGKKWIFQSPKWSWILHNRYERINTYHKGTRFVEKQRNYILISRINAEAAKYQTNYKSMAQYLKQEDIHLNIEMLFQLAVYEPSSFKCLCELVKRLEIDERWDEVTENGDKPENCFDESEVKRMNAAIED